jgi:hypothetical protein
VFPIAVSFDLNHAREAAVELPVWKYSLPDHASLEGEELMTGQRFVWQRKIQQSRLAPAGLAMGVARVHPVRHTAVGSTIPCRSFTAMPCELLVKRFFDAMTMAWAPSRSCRRSLTT